MNTRVFCGNLPWSLSDDDLKDEMSKFGSVTEVHIVTDKDTGRSRGFGFVTFASEESAEEAFQAGNVLISGRQVNIDRAKERKQRR